MNRWRTETGINTLSTPEQLLATRAIVGKMNTALTLSWKQGMHSEPDRTNIVYLQRDDIHKCHKHFVGNIVRNIYNQRHRKNGARIPSIFFVEGGDGTDKRWHTHGALRLPDWCLKDEPTKMAWYETIVNDCYKPTKWAYKEYTIEPIYNANRYSDYIGKDGFENLDLDNTTI